jgi:hypothetical protein
MAISLESEILPVLKNPATKPRQKVHTHFTPHYALACVMWDNYVFLTHYTIISHLQAL